jgi:hypothetical protein
VEAPEGSIEGVVRVREHVPDQERQDPDRGGGKELAKARPVGAQLAEGQPEQDGRPGDEAEKQV